MPTASSERPVSFLLPRICESVPLRLACKTAPLCLTCPLPAGACFSHGCLSAPTTLEDIILTTTHAGHGCKFTAQLYLPVCTHFVYGCEQLCRTGCIQLPIQAMLRTPANAALQYIPQAELCIRNVFTQNSCLCAEFDLRLSLYAVQLQPATLCIACTEPKPDCMPFFNLPLYPELPVKM